MSVLMGKLGEIGTKGSWTTHQTWRQAGIGGFAWMQSHTQTHVEVLDTASNQRIFRCASSFPRCYRFKRQFVSCLPPGSVLTYSMPWSSALCGYEVGVSRIARCPECCECHPGTTIG